MYLFEKVDSSVKECLLKMNFTHPLEVDYICIRLQMHPFKKSTPEISKNEAAEGFEVSK